MWRHSIHLSRGPDFAMFDFDILTKHHKLISIEYLIRHHCIKKNFNYLHIALIFSRQCDVYLFYQCLHLYIHLCMFIHETIYTINVRKTKMESFFFIDMLVEESTHAWRARGWYVMDKDKVIHIYLAHPPSTIFYLPVNMGNKVGQVSYFDGIQPHVFNADKTIMQYMPVYKCATRHKSMQ